MIIRPFNSGDAKTFYRWYHDKRLSHFYRGFIYGVSLEQCKNAVELLKGHILVGLHPETCEPVGAVTLADRDRILRVYKLGLLVDPDHQHQNYGKDLLTYGLKWAFETMNAHRVVAEVICEDDRTMNGVRKAGFIAEGLSRQTMYLDGKYYDEAVFSMLRPDYERVKNG